MVCLQNSAMDDSEVKCLVLLAVYNGIEWLDEQIESILSQPSFDISIVISVDLSTDGSYEKVLNLAKYNSKISVLPYGIRYGGAGRNFLRLVTDVDISGFDIIAFSDQDDVWLDGKLQRAWLKLSHDGFDVFSSDVTAFWGDGRTALIKKSGPQRLYDHFYEAAGPGCTYVFSVRAFRSVQRFVLKNSNACAEVALHDWLFYAYCRQAGFRWHIDNQPLMLYRQHLNNQVGTNNNFSAFIKRFKLIKNGWYRGQIKIIADLVAPSISDKLCNRLFIITHIGQLRRRLRDRMFLLFLAITGLL